MTGKPLSSIFEVFKIGAGPSSSHSMGPQRAAAHFRRHLKHTPQRIQVTLFGSLAATGRGHWTDRVLQETLAPVPCEIVWDVHTLNLRHPNTLRFEAFGRDGAVQETWTAYSIGGGNIADMHGPVDVLDQATYPVSCINEALDYCRAHTITFWQLVEQTEQDLWPRLAVIWKAMCAGVQRGLNSAQIVLPGALEVPRRAPITWQRAAHLKSPQRDFAMLSAYALATAEENAAGGTVVTAPTCGSAGVLPGLLYYFKTLKRAPTRKILEALATAGLFGASIRANATVSGAEAGCQAEIGSACSMAAAGAAHLLGASLQQLEYAAEMGMEHHLGLTCDPVEGYVQIPCIERNMTACWRAFECSAFALLTDGRHLVSYDDVIEVMRATGSDLQCAYRETSRGGLAQLWRRDLEQRLKK